MSRAAKTSSLSSILVLIALLLSLTALAAASDTTTTSVCSVSPATSQVVGGTVTLTALITDTTANNSPDGTVQFTYTFNGGSVQNLGAAQGLTLGKKCNGTTSASASIATLAISTLPAGTYTFGAVYTPLDATWLTSTDPTPAAYTITKNASSAGKPTITPNTSVVVGRSVAIASVITGVAGEQLDGAVQFFDGSIFLGAAQLPASTSGTSTATLNTASLSAGAHASIKATYVGNSLYSASAASTAATSITIGTRGTSTALPAVGSAAVPNSPTSIIANVTDTGIIPSGTRGGFAATTGALAGGLSRHASALLSNGNVLITGGMDSTGAPQSATLVYSLSTGLFTAGATMNDSRTGHTETLLQDGTILVVGGSNAANGAASGALATAEIYDPVANTFTKLNTCAGASPQCLQTARTNHTATLMPNGNVLITGGENNGGTLSSAEVYVPSSQSFNALPSTADDLKTARRGHTATLLTSGATSTILIAGGDAAGTSEIYSYVAGSPGLGSSVLSSDNLTTARSFHSATALPDGLIVFMGGETAAAAVNSIEFYNPSGTSPNKFSSTASVMPTDTTSTRQGHTARLLGDGTILVVGGSATLDDPTAAYTSAYLYTPPYDPIGALSFTAKDNANVNENADMALGNCGTILPTGTGTTTCTGSFTPTTVGSNPHTITGTYTANTVHATSTNTTSVTVGLSLTGVVPQNKPYDGTTTATVDLSGATLSGTVTGKTAVSFDPNTYTATFADANVGTGKSVTLTVPLTGTDAAYYGGSVTMTVTANITTKAITAALTASSKIYDKTNVEPNANMTCQLTGVIAADTSSMVCTATAGTFDVFTVAGSPHTVSATATISDTGSGAAANYTLGAAGTTTTSTTVTGPASVTPKSLNVSGITVTPKTYDGTQAATLDVTNEVLLTAEAAGAGTTSDGAPYTGDAVTLVKTPATGTYGSRNVATGIAVSVTGDTLTGADAGNYQLAANEQPTLTGNITAKALTMTGLSVPASRTYNATLVAVVSGTPTLQTAEATGTGTTSDGIPYSVDSVSITGTPVGTYDFKDVATATQVTFSGLSLTGAGNGNYTLTMQAPQSATITAKTLAVTGLTAVAKTYDATATATFTGTAALLTAEAPGAGTTSDNKPYTGDTVSLSGSPTGTFASKDVGPGIAVTVSGNTLSGAQAGNYQLATNEQSGLTANINPKTLTVTGLSVSNRTYDTTNVAGLTGTAALLTQIAPGTGTSTDGASYTGDTVTLNGSPAGTFASIHVGTHAVTVAGQNISGPQVTLGDYVLAANEQSGLSGTIGTAALTANLTAANKSYDGTQTEPNASMNCSFTGVISGELTPPACAATAGTFATANAGTGITVSATVTLSGSSDYTLGAAGTAVTSLNPVTTTASILTLAVTPTLTAASKPYDGNNTEADASMSCTLAAGNPTDQAVLTADGVNVTCTPSLGTFDSVNAGARTVSATATIGGAKAANYTFGTAGTTTLTTSTTAASSITTVALGHTFTPQDRPYDRTTTEANANMTCSVTGAVNGESLACSPSSGTFDSANAGARTVNATISVTIGGVPASNYTLGTAGTTATSLAVSGPANITTLAVTPTLAAQNKTYDGSTAEPNANMACSLAAGNPTDQAVLTADGTNVTCTPSAGTFASALIGSHNVNATATIGGTAGSNYTFGAAGTTVSTLTPVTATASITAVPLVATLTAASKPYDRTVTEPDASMSCTLAPLNVADATIFNAEKASLTCTPSAGTFDGANAGAHVVTATATIGGAAVGDYTLGAAGSITPTTATSVTANSSITTLLLTPTLIAGNKPYDGTNVEPNNNMSCTLAGTTPGDQAILTADGAGVTCTPSAGTFATPDMGSQLVTATVTIGGTAGANYTFGAAGNNTPSTTATATATISTIQVVATLTASNKPYDRTTTEPNGNMSCTLATVVAGNQTILTADGSNVTCTPSAGTFATANAGSQTVTATVTIGGSKGGDYTFGSGGTTSASTTATATATIVTVPITATLTAPSKVYDGTTTEPNAAMSCSLTGVISGDTVVCTPTAGTFNSATVAGASSVTATGTISGAPAANYTLGAAGTTVTSKQLTASSSITRAPLTVTADNKTKIFDGAVFPVASYTATISGFVNGETDAGLRTAGTLSGAATYTGTAITATNFGTFVITPQIGSLSAANYSFVTFTNGSLVISPAIVKISAVTSYVSTAFDTTGKATTDSFKFDVTVTGNGVPPGGSITLTDGTTTLVSNVTLAAGSGAVSTMPTQTITLATAATPHAITVTYVPASNASYQQNTFIVNVTAAPSAAALTAGSTTGNTVNAPVVYSGNPTASGTLSSADLANNCTIKSTVLTVIDPNLVSCTAVVDKTLTQGTGTASQGTVTVTIKTTSGTVSTGALRETGPSSIRALYALSFGMPAVVFIGLAGPLGAVGRKKALRGKLVTWLGLILLCALLSMSIGCGGGFSNPQNLGPVSIQRTVPGSYTAVVTYKDAGGNPQVLATIPFSVQ